MSILVLPHHVGAHYPARMSSTQEERRADPIRQGVGMRLRAAREGKELTQQQVADRFGVTKATVSAWETGGGDPGVYRLRELSQLYDVATDALLWEDSLTPEAMRFAAEFDSLTEKQRSLFKAMWMAFVTEAASDEKVGNHIPPVPSGKKDPA